MSQFLTQLDLDSIQFPSPRHALAQPNGLLAIVNLSPARLLAAYHNGIFPWYGPHDPILWWSPDPRGIIEPQHAHISRSMKKFIHHHPFEIWINRSFMDTVKACAAPRRDCTETWINQTLIASYERCTILATPTRLKYGMEQKWSEGYTEYRSGKFFVVNQCFPELPIHPNSRFSLYVSIYVNMVESSLIARCKPSTLQHLV